MTQNEERKNLLGVILCATALLLGLLAATALVANQRTLTRGIPAGLPDPVAGADVPPLCINAPLAQYDAPQLDAALDQIASGGFAWLRLSFPWAQIEPAPGQYDWQRWDRLVEAAAARELRLIAVLDSAPAWAGSPPPPADFARFAATLAARYDTAVDAYQVWHNPNLADGWGANPNPAAYADLLRQSAEAIRAADPAATIVLGSLAPTVEQGPQNLAEPLFLERLYAAGAAPFFDIVAVQPYGFDTGPDDRRVSLDILNFSRPILVRETMVAHDDAAKAVWASHFGWNSLPADWADVPSIWGQVDPQTQAAYTAAAVERARQEWPWMGALCLAHYQPQQDAVALPSGTPNADRHWGFAAVAPDGSPRPVFSALAALAAQPPFTPPGAYTPLSGVAEWLGDWQFSELGADVSENNTEQLTIPFWGSDLGLRVRRGNYRAYLYVTVDGQPANRLPEDAEGHTYLVLTSPDYAPQVTTIPVAARLEPGPHTAVVVAERGWGQWPLAGWSVAYHPDETVYALSLAGLGLVALAALAGALFLGRRVQWDALTRAAQAAWGRLAEPLQWLIAALTTLVLWASAWLTWGASAASAFRRLGDGVGITATLAAAGLLYYSPWFLLTVLAGLLLLAIILLRPEFGLALIVALAPFYTFPRLLLDRAFSMAEIVTLMTLASWGVRQLVKQRRTGTEAQGNRGANCSLATRLSCSLASLRPGDLAVFLLVLVSILSCFLADFQRVAWRELRLVILEPAALYLMLRTTRPAHKTLWRLVDFFIVGGVAVALIGLVQYALGANLITAEGGLPRLRSVYGSPNNVGLYLGRVLPLLVAIPLFAGNRRRRLLYGLAALPVGAALLLSFSKGALLLGLPAALLTIGLLAGGRWLWATLTAVVAAGLAAIPLLRLPRFASLLDTQGGTTFFRLKLWQATVSMIRDHPWLGVGLDNFLYQYRGRYILPEAWQEPDLSHPHNMFLDHWSRLGIGGLVAGLWLQLSFWRTALPLRRLHDRDGRALALGLMGAMADTLAHGLVDHSFFLIDLAFVFFLTLGLVHLLDSLRFDA